MAMRTRARLVRANAVDEPDTEHGDGPATNSGPKTNCEPKANCGPTTDCGPKIDCRCSMISIQDTQVVENAAGGTGIVSDGEVGNGRAGKHDTAVLRGRNNTNENDVGSKTVASIEADSGAVVSCAPSEPQPVSEPGCSRTPDEPSSAPQPLIPRRFKRPPLLRARTTQLNLVKSPPSPPLEIRKHYGRSMSVPATAGDDDLQPCFLNMAALPETSVQNIRTHYYPEGGWGWCVLAVAAALHGAVAGLQTAFGALLAPIVTEFFTEGAGEREEQPAARQAVWQAGWLGATSLGFSLLISPLTIAICRRKSTRLTAVIGGLVAALGILFTSFASRFHQLFLSYGAVFAVGVSMTRDASTLMVGQYFKRRRELVETVVLSGSGVGLAVMSAFLHGAIGSEGWRLGLQAVTGVIFFTFLLGTFYRSASLYHPQRRAILHLKNSKKKVKGKNKVDEKPPFFDCSMLKSQTVRILLVSASLSSVGLHSPLIYMAHQAQQDGLSESSVLLLQTYLGLGWALGCWAFGFVVVRNNQECRISRQYLCQASSFLCGACQLALPAVRGYSGYVLFAWLYGLFYGGYQYSLKMCTYEKVRARNFAKTWGFVQGSQALPMVIGVPVTGYINVAVGGKAGYYFSATFVVIGSISIFLIAFHRRRGRRRAHRHRHEPAPGGEARAEPPETPRDRADSLPDVDERVLNLLKQRVAAVNSSHELRKQELTCISEEGIADMDLPDALFEDIELELNLLQGDITSCNKVENYLVLSEYENNLIAEQPTDRRPAVGRRRSLVKQVSSMRSRAAQILASKPADIPEERSDVENDLPSDSSVSSRLFRGWIRGGRRKEAPTEVPAVHPVSVQTPAPLPPANSDPAPQT